MRDVAAIQRMGLSGPPEHPSDGEGSPVFQGNQELRLASSERQGFRLEGDDGWLLAAVPAEGRHVIEGSGLTGCWYLREQPDERGCFVLREGAGDDALELGRTTRGPAGMEEGVGTYVLLGDGRLFRILARGPRDPRFDLMSWETAGAYLSARPDQVLYRSFDRNSYIPNRK